jgi:WG containing repeat
LLNQKSHQCSGFTLVLKDSGLWGYIDRNGLYRIKPQFNAARDFSDGCAVVSKNSENFRRYDSFITTDGKIHTVPRAVSICAFSNGFAKAQLIGSSEMWKVDKNEKLSKDVAADGLPSSRDTQAKRANPSLQKFCDIQQLPSRHLSDNHDKFVFPKVYKSVGNFSEGVCSARIISVGDLQLSTYIDDHGEKVIAPCWNFGVGDFSEGLAACRIMTTDGLKTGFKDKSGEWKILPNYYAVGNFHNGLARVLNRHSKLQFMSKIYYSIASYFITSLQWCTDQIGKSH